ncbi:MAG: DJ-1/PfpI family protein [Clostridiales bacterium]|nr:DJ-1/PfpI family protein [Clostridiales bacterium]
MNNKSEMLGRKVAVLVETEYIPAEVEFYKTFFEGVGAKVDFMTYLWGNQERKLICDITDTEHPEQAIHTMLVKKEIANCNPNDYDIVLIAANYVACRLREIPPMGSLANAGLLRSPAAVRFIASAMTNQFIVKGALCHALWLLTPVPELLKGRKVICHTVVLADIYNAGGVYVPDQSHVVVDNDLVTARSAGDLDAYGEALISTWRSLQHKNFQ